jgi:hypothetical protein
MGLRVQGSMFKVQGWDGALNVEPVTLNRAEGVMEGLFLALLRHRNCGIRV